VNIRYTLPALADLDSILTYISATSPRGAARVQKRIQDVVGLLLAHPEIGLRTDDSGYPEANHNALPVSRFLRDSEPGDHHPRHPPWCSRSRQDARHARL
jgi:plasmid stabilization system protein ParE